MYEYSDHYPPAGTVVSLVDQYFLSLLTHFFLGWTCISNYFMSAIVCNTPFVLPSLSVVPEFELRVSYFWLLLVKKQVRKLDLMEFLMGMRSHREINGIELLKVKAVRMEIFSCDDKKPLVAVDGELKNSTVIEVSVIPTSTKVMLK